LPGEVAIWPGRRSFDWRILIAWPAITRTTTHVLVRLIAARNHIEFGIDKFYGFQKNSVLHHFLHSPVVPGSPDRLVIFLWQARE
jgi:hypothetical protein